MAPNAPSLPRGDSKKASQMLSQVHTRTSTPIASGQHRSVVETGPAKLPRPGGKCTGRDSQQGRVAVRRTLKGGLAREHLRARFTKDDIVEVRVCAAC